MIPELVGAGPASECQSVMQRSETPPILDYGATERINIRRAARWLIGSVAILAGIAVAISFAISSFNHYEENGVRATLQDIPNARVLQVNAFYDGPGDKVIWADVSVDGGATKVIRFRAPMHHQLNRGERMLIESIGPYGVLVYLRGEPWSQPGLSVGRDSELAAVLPFKFNNVRDVAANYDELLNFVAAQPSGTFTDATGKVSAWRIQVRPK